MTVHEVEEKKADMYYAQWTHECVYGHHLFPLRNKTIGRQRNVVKFLAALDFSQTHHYFAMEKSWRLQTTALQIGQKVKLPAPLLLHAQTPAHVNNHARRPRCLTTLSQLGTIKFNCFIFGCFVIFHLNTRSTLRKNKSLKIFIAIYCVI